VSPFLEQYARSIGHEPPPRPAIVQRQPAALARSVRFELLEQRQCFICYSWGACIHREPELLITVIEEGLND
jgi:hypothetical protein